MRDAIMILISGEYYSIRVRGIVADKCSNCGRVTTLRVVERYRTAHLYFIPLGFGRQIGSYLKCCECGDKSAGTLENYAKVLPRKMAKGLTTGEVLQQTNPRLAESLACRARLEQDVLEARPAAPGAPDPRMTLASVRLADLNSQDPRVLEFQDRIAHWNALDAVAQTKLLHAVDAFVNHCESHEATVRFLWVMGKRFRSRVSAGQGFGVLTFLAAVGLGIPAMVFLLQQKEQRPIGALVVVLSAAVIAPIAGWWYRRRVHRRFFRSTFVPEADSREVGVALAVSLLQSVDPSDRQISRGVRSLANGLPLLKQVLDAEGRLEEIKWDLESSWAVQSEQDPTVVRAC
jgi:hypothetical protein